MDYSEEWTSLYSRDSGTDGQLSVAADAPLASLYGKHNHGRKHHIRNFPVVTVSVTPPTGIALPNSLRVRRSFLSASLSLSFLFFFVLPFFCRTWGAIQPTLEKYPPWPLLSALRRPSLCLNVSTCLTGVLRRLCFVSRKVALDLPRRKKPSTSGRTCRRRSSGATWSFVPLKRPS